MTSRRGKDTRMFSMRRLDIYLNDHLAGATFGLGVTQRALARSEGTKLGEFLAQLQAEIVADKETLETIMAGSASTAPRLSPLALGRSRRSDG